MIGGLLARDLAQHSQVLPEDMAFLKSLGLSDELRDKVYEMLTAKADLFWVHEEKIKEAAQKRENYTGYISELRQMEADTEAAVGTENYGKIKYYETTPLERLQTAGFKRYLQGRSQPLTEQQEAAVVDGMVQERGGKASFSLMSVTRLRMWALVTFYPSHSSTSTSSRSSMQGYVGRCH